MKNENEDILEEYDKKAFIDRNWRSRSGTIITGLSS